MQTGRFTLALLAFGMAVFAVDRAVAWFPAVPSDVAGGEIATPSLGAVVQPFAEVESAPVLVGGIRILGEAGRTGLSPREATDAAERRQAEKLGAWRAARAHAAFLGGPRPVDDLTIPLRVDTATWSMAAVLRAPEGFTAKNFSGGGTLERAEPTDDIVVFLAMAQGAGSIVNTMRFDAAQLAMASENPLPAAIARMQGQTQMLEIPPIAPNARWASLRLCDVGVESAAARRMSVLALEGVKAEVSLRDSKQVIIFAETNSWTATIMIAAEDRDGPAMELVQYEPIGPGGSKP